MGVLTKFLTHHIFGSGGGRNGSELSLDFMDHEDEVLVDFLVHGEFSCLAEGAVAAILVALEWFLLCVDVHVFLQILREREGLEAQDTDVFLDSAVRGDVSAE